MKPLLLLLAVIAPTLPAFAATSSALTTTNEACRCDAKVADPFEIPLAIATGPLAGKCLDSCRYRAPKVLTDGDTLEVANVMHDGRYEIASVDPKGAYQVDLLLEQFLTGVNHTALRVRFAPDVPIRLRSQTAAPGASYDAESHDLVFSVEAALPRGESFTFLNASNGAFPLDYRITTIEESRRWMLGEKKHNVRQYRLRLDPDAIQRLVRQAIAKSPSASFASPYYLFTANCASSEFEMLDQATGMAPPSGAGWSERAWPVDGPFGTVAYLYSAGLISARLPDLGKPNDSPPAGF